MKKRRLLILFLTGIIVLAGGCSKIGKLTKEKIKDVDFTVVSYNDMPSGVKSIIEDKKKNPFWVAYTNEEYTYIIIGYGEQKHEDYSIKVKSLYETENSIKVKTVFNGPKKYSENETASYPYIVIKIEATNKNIVFSE